MSVAIPVEPLCSAVQAWTLAEPYSVVFDVITVTAHARPHTGRGTRLWLL
jgi:hypothetical protein